jgi:hypothetical protein
LAIFVPWGNVISLGSGVASLGYTTDPREEKLFLGQIDCERFRDYRFILAVRDHDMGPNSTMAACGFALAQHGDLPSEVNVQVNDLWESNEADVSKPLDDG